MFPVTVFGRLKSGATVPSGSIVERVTVKFYIPLQKNPIRETLTKGQDIVDGSKIGHKCEENIKISNDY